MACRPELEPSQILSIEVEPRPHQTEVLEALEVEREAGHHRNLIVAATGTGKTFVAAFDFRALCAEQTVRPSLLFVAHRWEILSQSARWASSWSPCRNASSACACRSAASIPW